MNRIALALGTVVALSGAPAATAGGHERQPFDDVPKDAATAKRLAVEGEARSLVGFADLRLYFAHPECQPAGPAQTTFTPDTPAAATLNLVAALRRPAGAGDVMPAGTAGLVGFFTPHEVYGTAARRVPSMAGMTLTILVARGAPPIHVPADIVRQTSVACVDAEIADVRSRGVTEGPMVLAEELRQLAAARRKLAAGPPSTGPVVDRLYLYEELPRTHTGALAGDVDAARFARRGILVGSALGATNTRTTVIGLVPDGVASVEFRYARVAGRGADYRPFVYPSASSTTATVRENLVSASVPRWSGDALAPTMVWRSRAGKVLRVVRP
jgi:hypothetical protein